MLKKIIDKLDSVDEKYRDLYAKGADEKFHLGVEDDDGEELRRAKEHEKAARKAAEEKAKKAQEDLDKTNEALKKLQEAQDDKHRQAGDVESLEKSWQEKFSTREAELTQQASQLQAVIEKQMVDNVAQSTASELAGENAAILLPHIKGRLSVEVVDGEARTRVLDKSGKPSALTVEELKNEFFTSDSFAAIIIGSKANGSGASGGQRGGGATKKKFSEMSASEKVAYKRKHGDEAYRRLKESDK